MLRRQRLYRLRRNARMKGGRWTPPDNLPLHGRAARIAKVRHEFHEFSLDLLQICRVRPTETMRWRGYLGGRLLGLADVLALLDVRDNRRGRCNGAMNVTSGHNQGINLFNSCLNTLPKYPFL